MNLEDTISKRPLLRYHGSKWKIAPWIISHFAEHRCYVEPFGGGAGVLLRKPRAEVEIYNDLDEDVFNLFRVLRQPEDKQRLVDAMILTPFSRREFRMAYEQTDEPVERARRMLVRSWCGFGSHSHNIANSNGFRTRDMIGRKSYAREFSGLPEMIAAAAQRFTGVTLECQDFKKLIPTYDDPRTLFYVDPPYPHSTRNCNKGYAFELSDHDHRILAFILKGLKGKVVISGYQCALYEELYADWRMEKRTAYANGQNGNVERTECIWMNF